MNGARMAKSTWIGDVQDGLHDGASVELKGWVKRTRGSNKIRFVVLRDSTGVIQCVGKRDTLGDAAFESLKEALIESSIVLRGTQAALMSGQRAAMNLTLKALKSLVPLTHNGLFPSLNPPC